MVTNTERKRIREVQRLAEKAEPLQEYGTGGPGRGHVAPRTRPPRPRGMTKAYLVARIARDRPDILARMQAGEFVTVRQAAIAAGIMQNPTRLDHVRKLWRHASEDERQAMAVDVMRWLLDQEDAVYDAILAHAAHRPEECGRRPAGKPASGREEQQRQA